MVLFLLTAETGEAGEPLFALISGGTDPTMPDELPLTLGSSRYSSFRFCRLRRYKRKAAPQTMRAPRTTPTAMPAMAPVLNPECFTGVPVWRSPVGSCEVELLSDVCPGGGVVEEVEVEKVVEEDDDDESVVDYETC